MTIWNQVGGRVRRLEKIT